MQTNTHKGRYISIGTRKYCSMLLYNLIRPDSTITEQQTVANMQAKFAQICESFYLHIIYIHGRVDEFGMCAIRVSLTVCVGLGWGCSCGYSATKSLLVSSVLFGGLKCSVRCFEVVAIARSSQQQRTHKAQKSTVCFL